MGVVVGGACVSASGLCMGVHLMVVVYGCACACNVIVYGCIRLSAPAGSRSTIRTENVGVCVGVKVSVQATVVISVAVSISANLSVSATIRVSVGVEIRVLL